MIDLRKLSRAELNDHAQSLGIVDASDTKTFGNRDDLIAAIEKLDEKQITTIAPIVDKSHSVESRKYVKTELDDRGRVIVPDGYVFDGFGVRERSE